MNSLRVHIPETEDVLRASQLLVVHTGRNLVFQNAQDSIVHLDVEGLSEDEIHKVREKIGRLGLQVQEK